MSNNHEDFPSYTYGEGKTKIGQFIKFTAPRESIGIIKDLLQKHIRTIDIPTAKMVNVPHGGYGQYSRYEIVQHEYAAGDGENGDWAYIEVLEIKNPPEGRCGYIINENTSQKGGRFSEWETIEQALEAYAKHWSKNDTNEVFPKLPGYKRQVICGALMPWFYAVGDEDLIGDYTFPEGLQDDPVYRFGKKFVVSNDDELPIAKTCMGTRFIEEKETNHYRSSPTEKNYYRLVYWDDGSVWNEKLFRNYPPRPLEENEIWITEAVWQFKRMLAGKSDFFTINFLDGNKFVGTLKKTDTHARCEEGEYFISAKIKGEKKQREGTIDNFKPTKEIPNIMQFVKKRFEETGKEIEAMKVESSKLKKGGKKWSGVFFNPI